MSKKKQSSGAGAKSAAASRPKQPAAKATASKSKTPLIIATLAVIGVIAAIVIIGGRGSGSTATAGATGASGTPAATAGTPPQPTAEEAKYIGRLLPASYVAPKVAEAAVYTATVKMTPITAKVDAASISIPVADVAADKIISFQYTKPSGEVVPLLAYVRPSGKVFVGVNFCIPCKGTGQRLETDGTLTCESCGTKRDPETLVGISGACKLYPLDELPVTVVGGNLVLDKAPLDAWIAQPLDRKVGA
jgi:Membrane iron-sulfur containing protein FtrD-like